LEKSVEVAVVEWRQGIRAGDEQQSRPESEVQVRPSRRYHSLESKVEKHIVEEALDSWTEGGPSDLSEGQKQHSKLPE